jgi:hypothetical protein
VDDAERRVFLLLYFVRDGRRRNDNLVGLAINLEAGVEIGGNRRCVGWHGKDAVVISAFAHRGWIAVEAVLGVPEPDREAGGGDGEQDSEDEGCFAQQHWGEVKEICGDGKQKHFARVAVDS